MTGAAAPEDPLPLVHAKSAIDFAPPQVALAIEPQLTDATPVAISANDAPAIEAILHDALTANDLPRFEAGLTRARAIVDAMPSGAARDALRREIDVDSDIDHVWSFAASDRFGAFYDNDALPGVYDHLTATYPGYAAAMAEQRLVDNAGHVFYPTSETRAFLAKQLAAPQRQHEVVRVATKRQPRAAKTTTHVKVVGVEPTVPKPVSHPKAATDALANDIRKAAQPPVAQPVVQPVAKPAIDAQAAAVAGTQPIAEPESSGGATIFLILLALLAVGVVTMFVRTPREEVKSVLGPTIMPAPVAEAPELTKKAS